MSEDYKEALLALHKALAELKSLGRECEEKIQGINIILERQGLKDWAAGEAVNKAYCKDSHENLTCSVIDSIEKLEKRIQNRIVGTWAVLTFILGAYGLFLLEILNEIFG